MQWCEGMQVCWAMALWRCVGVLSHDAVVLCRGAVVLLRGVVLRSCVSLLCWGVAQDYCAMVFGVVWGWCAMALWYCVGYCTMALWCCRGVLCHGTVVLSMGAVLLCHGTVQWWYVWRGLCTVVSGEVTCITTRRCRILRRSIGMMHNLCGCSRRWIVFQLVTVVDSVTVCHGGG